MVLAGHLGLAQIVQHQRYELPLQENEAAYTITPVDEQGLFLHRLLLGNESDHIELIKLDTALSEAWRGTLPIERKQMLVGRRSHAGRIYFLFRPISGTQFDLYSIRESDGRYNRYTFKSFIRFNTSEFQVEGESILIGGYFNRVPLVLHFDLRTQQSRILPGIFNEEGELTQIRTYDDGTFQVLISARSTGKQKTIWLKDYAADGMLISNYALRTDPSKSLLFARSIKTTSNKQIITGVYGNRYGDYSRGVFVATIDPAGLQQMRYYNYADLENFFHYMRAKRENRVKERIERRKVKGKKIRFNYRVLIHDLIEDDGQFIMLGEAFYPQYTSISRSNLGYRNFFSSYTPYNTSYIRGDQVFDGYRYTHAVVIGFDSNGNLLWDNSFEINDVKTYTLEQYVRLSAEDDRIVLLYLFENQLRSKIIKGDQVLEGKSSDPLMTLYSTDLPLVERDNSGDLESWYEHYFLAFGTQHIVNPTNPAAPKRRVFYINKISY
jgi:hypothetical protein